MKLDRSEEASLHKAKRKNITSLKEERREGLRSERISDQTKRPKENKDRERIKKKKEDKRREPRKKR